MGKNVRVDCHKMTDESECRILQDEVLTSIYDGDAAFVTVTSGQKYQYKIGDPEAESGGKSSIIVEFEWTAEFPQVIPQINLDVFFNRDITIQVKNGVSAAVREEAEQY